MAVKKKILEWLELVMVLLLITVMVIPVLLTMLLLLPIHYCFDLRLQSKEKDKYNS